MNVTNILAFVLLVRYMGVKHGLWETKMNQLWPVHRWGWLDGCVNCVGYIRQTDRYSSVVLKDSLGFEEGIAAVLRQSRLIWYTHVLRKDEGDWVRRCLAYAVEGIWPKKTWKEVELKCLYLRASNALDHNKWRKLIRDKRSHSDDESGDSI